MKLYTTLESWKRHSQKKALRTLYCAARRKHYKKIKQRQALKKYNNKNQARHAAPENFSLINNTDNIIRFFEETKQSLVSGNNLFIDIKNITNMTIDAVALLCATINDPTFNCGRTIRGNSPTDIKLAYLLRGSGFYNHVSSRDKPKSNTNVCVHKVTKNKVENEIAKSVCEKAVQKIFGELKKFRPLYEILIELMANTNNHANPEYEGAYNWWLFMDCNSTEDKVTIAFLDLGVGVINSGPVQGYLKSAFTAIGARSNSDVIKDVFHGKLRSRTALDERGRGMPLIYSHSKMNNFSKFIIITNRVHGNLKTDKFTELNHDFNGTLWYLELKNSQYVNN